MAHETRAGILAGKPTLSPPIDTSERGVIVMVDEHSEAEHSAHEIAAIRRIRRIAARHDRKPGTRDALLRIAEAAEANLATEAKLARVREVMGLRQVRHDCKVGWSAAMQFLDEAMADQPGDTEVRP